jgi:hypothetical protein
MRRRAVAFNSLRVLVEQTRGTMRMVNPKIVEGWRKNPKSIVGAERFLLGFRVPSSVG